MAARGDLMAALQIGFRVPKSVASERRGGGFVLCSTGLDGCAAGPGTVSQARRWPTAGGALLGRFLPRLRAADVHAVRPLFLRPGRDTGARQPSARSLSEMREEVESGAAPCRPASTSRSRSAAPRQRPAHHAQALAPGASAAEAARAAGMTERSAVGCAGARAEKRVQPGKAVLRRRRQHIESRGVRFYGRSRTSSRRM